MPRPLKSRVRAGGLATIASLLLFPAVAQSASGRYRGTTSQHLPISFALARNALRKLDFRIDDKCPSGHVWRIHDYDFPAIHVSHSWFDTRFRSLSARATAEVKGRVLGRKVIGTVSDRTLIAKEGDYCHGSAKFTVRM
jgi:hypothetical protein